MRGGGEGWRENSRDGETKREREREGEKELEEMML